MGNHKIETKELELLVDHTLVQIIKIMGQRLILMLLIAFLFYIAYMVTYFLRSIHLEALRLYNLDWDSRFILLNLFLTISVLFFSVKTLNLRYLPSFSIQSNIPSVSNIVLVMLMMGSVIGFSWLSMEKHQVLPWPSSTAIPIRFAVTDTGKIHLAPSNAWQIHEIGSYNIADEQEFQSIRSALKLAHQRVLIVRIDDRAIVYELEEGKHFSVEFEGLGLRYDIVSLEYEPDGDIVLELLRGHGQVEPWYCLIEPNATLNGVQVCSPSPSDPTLIEPSTGTPMPMPEGTLIP